jgi:hypothetical protein
VQRQRSKVIETVPLFLCTMMPTTGLFSLLQILFGLMGMTWKTREGFPVIDALQSLYIPGLTDVVLNPKAASLFDICVGTSLQSLCDDWPWFSLHLILYVGQLIGFILIIMHEQALCSWFSIPWYVCNSPSQSCMKTELVLFQGFLYYWAVSPCASDSPQPCPSYRCIFSTSLGQAMFQFKNHDILIQSL